MNADDALTVQLLEWVGSRPRSYAETIDAWRTSCPRLTIWEDAMSEGLLERISGAAMRDAQVRLTSAGKDRLKCARRNHAPRT